MLALGFVFKVNVHNLGIVELLLLVKLPTKSTASVTVCLLLISWPKAKFQYTLIDPDIV